MYIEHTLDWGLVIGALIAACGALLALNQWHKELIGRKKAELSERILVASAKCYDAIMNARSLVSYEGEGISRPLYKGESEKSRSKVCDSYYSKIERLRESEADFEELRELYYIMKAYEGCVVEKAVNPIFNARNEIIHAAYELIDMVQTKSINKDFQKKMKSIIYAAGKGDELKKSMDDAQEILEKICAPYLRRTIR